MKKTIAILAASALAVASCQPGQPKGGEDVGAAGSTERGEVELRQVGGPDIGSDPELAQPKATPSAVNFPKIIGWNEGRQPTAPSGFQVTLFADSLEYPRWLYVLPNGDVLVAEARTQGTARVPPQLRKLLEQSGYFGPSANRISRLRDQDGDGRAETRETFLDGLNQPFGMLALGKWFYVANTDALMRFPYDSAKASVTGAGKKILDLPAGGYNNHWTRNVIASPDGSKLYVSVGSATNVDDEKIDRKDPRRAAILEINPDGSGMQVFAAGLRNPNGMDWHPQTGALWTVVNERDELGDELVPDYLTSVKQGAFYGWPFAYWGSNVDPRRKGERPDLVKQAIAPDFAVGAHTATLGLTFGDGLSFPDRFRTGAFIGQHGSWNRSSFVGYRVGFVPFDGGQPTGRLEEFLTGFIADSSGAEVWGRPVGLAAARDGALLVADDAGDRIWRVAAR